MNVPTLQFLITDLVVLLTLVSLLWLVSLILRDVSIIDVFWGAGFVIATAWAVLQVQRWSPRIVILVVIVGLWGTRLAAYLLWRKWGHGEDYRYRAMRQRRGGSFWIWSWGAIFLLQGFLIWLIGLPLQLVPTSSRPLNPLDLLGVLLWLVGWLFETVADWQLAQFRADRRNQGQVLQSGLWRYTRHPNYFGDCLVWWGFYLVAAAAGFWWTALSPLLMTWLLLRVSGVALLEQSIDQRRPGYVDYQRRTNAFFPWPSRWRGKD